MKIRILFLIVAAVLVTTSSSLVGPGYLRAEDLALELGEDSPYTRMNVNTATAEELQQVRGIGPVIAERIIQYREENGNFETLDDLANVRGIGGSRFQQVKEQLVI